MLYVFGSLIFLNDQVVGFKCWVMERTIIQHVFQICHRFVAGIMVPKRVRSSYIWYPHHQWIVVRPALMSFGWTLCVHSRLHLRAASYSHLNIILIFWRPFKLGNYNNVSFINWVICRQLVMECIKIVAGFGEFLSAVSRNAKPHPSWGVGRWIGGGAAQNHGKTDCCQSWIIMNYQDKVIKHMTFYTYEK